ncbi:MAG: hypothetical protein ACLP8S_27040 [Solirubrobacteraceae bacterium]
MNISRSHLPDRTPTLAGDGSGSFRLDSERGISRSGYLLKRLLLVFWAIYFSLVALTNLVNLLGSIGAIHWAFLDSGNFGYMLSIVKIYHVGQTPTKLLLTGAVVLEVVAAFLFSRALLLGDRKRELRALCYGAGVWVVLIVMTEFFVAYASEAPFRELLLLTIATAIYVLLIPDRSPTRPTGENTDSMRIHGHAGQGMQERSAARRPRSAGLRWLTVTALIGGAVALFTCVALAETSMSLITAKRAVSGKTQTIVADGRGVTVYELGGESLAHLQCVTRACFNVWQPLKVPSASTKVGRTPGVPGTVGIMRRVQGGFYQVMLSRHPLYYYAGDKGRAGSTLGQGITSFGGTWHVIQAS